MNCVKVKNALLLLIATLCSACVPSVDTITIDSLLREMVDRDRITRFPFPLYQSLQESSYNRASVSPEQPGWFADSDGISCLRSEDHNGRTEWVMLDANGPGVVTKIWGVCFYYGMDDTTGGTVRVYIDGDEKPIIEENFFQLLQGKSFIKPPFAEESCRAGNIYLPIPYAKSCKITLDKKSFYYLINYRLYEEGTLVESFTMEGLREAEKMLRDVARELKQTPPTMQQEPQMVQKIAPRSCYNYHLPTGSNALTQLSIRLKAENYTQALRSTVLRVTFDDEQTIWCPIGDFFNNGVGKKSYQMWERSVTDDGEMICRWVMPYRNTARLDFLNYGDQQVELTAGVEIEKYTWNDASMHFHASWRMDDPTPCFPLFDYNLLSVKGQGVLVGDQLTVLNPSEGWWGEGDEKIYVDDDHKQKFPSHFGTGTEDYYGWAGGVVPTPNDEFSKPFLANVRVATPNSMGYNTCSRTRSLDAIPFRKQLTFDIESSCTTRASWYHLLYAATTFWYAKPEADSNRAPLPDKVKAPIMTLHELQQYNEHAKGKIFVVEGAIECENLKTYNVDASITCTPIESVWGDISNGKLESFHFSKKGENVVVRLTEQFEPHRIRLCATIGNTMGTFNIFVNNKKVGRVNFKAEHSGLTTPWIDLGKHEPVGNAFEIKFVYEGDGGESLGLDFFKLEK